MKNHISIIFSVIFTSLSQASLFRGWKSHEEDPIFSIASSRLTTQISTQTFDCSIYEIDGISLPGTTPLPPTWTCEIEDGTFTFDGDIQRIMRERFDFDITTAAGVKVTVPWEAVVNGTNIISAHEGIVINDNELALLNRNLLVAKAPLTGSTRVLVVRVTDSRGNAPSISLAELKNDYFQDSNNLKSRIYACSNGKLALHSAGVIDITINANSNGMLWRDVGNQVSAKLNGMNLNYDVRIFILPDVTNFSGAAAFAQVGGNTMWVKSEYAKFPSVQVHEYGHLLGARHSGKDGITYADNTCYMGNQVPWTDYGALMCFNAAKTWYFGWFSERHVTVSPMNLAFNGNIVGIADVVNKKSNSAQKAVLKIEGDDRNTYFLMYNRKKGINGGAMGGANEVVITKQNGSEQESWLEKELGDGQEWTVNNFASSGKTLVVKNCYTNSSSNGGADTANVLVYVKGRNDQQCGHETGNIGQQGYTVVNTGGDNASGQCTNKNWKDKYGDYCNWYANGADRCTSHGFVTGTNGWKASEACCICGGGNRKSGTNDSSTSSNNGNNGEKNGNQSGNIGNGNNNIWGSGNTAICVDIANWVDSEGLGCDYYKKVVRACQLFGNGYINKGYTPNQACCVCGGGQ